MRDVWKWKILGYPVATLTAHFTSTYTSDPFGNMVGIGYPWSEVAVVGLTGLFVGILVDEVLPHYLNDIRGNGGGGDIGGDLDTGGGGDLDLG